MELLQGRLEERRLSDLLLLVARRRGNGILTVQGDQEIIGLSFSDGELVSADALNQSLEEGLGQILTERDLVSSETLANLSAEHHAGGGRVVDLLVERNYVPRDVLCSALREHTYRLCVQVLRWRQGEFKFYRGDEVSHEEGVEPIPVEELFVRASDEVDTAAMLDGDLPDPETVFERVDRLDDTLSAETLGELLAPGLAEAEPGEQIESLLDRVDGRRTVAALARDTRMNEYRAQLTLLRMQQADLVRRREVVAGEAPADGRRAFAEPEPIAPPVVAMPEPPPPVAPPPVPPPLPVPRPAPRPAPARPTAVSPPTWIAWALAAGLLLAVGLYGLQGPWRLVVPFPWHADLRQALDAEREAAVFLRVDRAVRTFFLLEGRFPETLGELGEMALLPIGEIVDARGRPLAYSATAASFSLQVPVEGGASRTEGIAGNFLLDPEFQVTTVAAEPPLVLLD